MAVAILELTSTMESWFAGTFVTIRRRIKVSRWTEVVSNKLTEFIRVFYADSGYDTIASARASPMWLRLVDKMCNEDQLLPLRAACEVSCAKHSRSRIAAALKSLSAVSGVSASAEWVRCWLAVAR